MSEPEENGSGADEARAFKRWMVLNLIRVAGAVILCAGIAINEGLLKWPPVLAYVLVLVGFLTFFFLPNQIAKGWRSDDA